MTHLPMESASKICGEASQYSSVIGMWVAQGPHALLLGNRKFSMHESEKCKSNAMRALSLSWHKWDTYLCVGHPTIAERLVYILIWWGAGPPNAAKDSHPLKPKIWSGCEANQSMSWNLQQYYIICAHRIKVHVIMKSQYIDFDWIDAMNECSRLSMVLVGSSLDLAGKV